MLHVKSLYKISNLQQLQTQNNISSLNNPVSVHLQSGAPTSEAEKILDKNMGKIYNKPSRHRRTTMPDTRIGGTVENQPVTPTQRKDEGSTGWTDELFKKYGKAIDTDPLIETITRKGHNELYESPSEHSEVTNENIKTPYQKVNNCLLYTSRCV